ncbi:Phosphoglucomutase/phosphomannomutase, alpha/beta/alpha protein, partial [human gut metagenome]
EGSQILDDIAGQIAGHMDEIVNFEDIKSIPFEEALEILDWDNQLL